MEICPGVHPSSRSLRVVGNSVTSAPTVACPSSTALRTARAYIERDLTTATEQCCPVDKRGRPLLKKMDEASKPMINEMRELLAAGMECAVCGA